MQGLCPKWQEFFQNVQKTVDKTPVVPYNISCTLVRFLWRYSSAGRAPGSYPACHLFESDYRYQQRPVGQAVKTPPFHGGNMGSIPVRVTKKDTPSGVSFFCHLRESNMKIRITSGDPGAPVQTLVRSYVFGKAEDANDSRTGHQKRTHHPVCPFFGICGNRI